MFFYQLAAASFTIKMYVRDSLEPVCIILHCDYYYVKLAPKPGAPSGGLSCRLKLRAV